MTTHATRLKRILHEAALDANVPVRRLYDEYDVEELFAHRLNADDPPALLAAKLLDWLCIEDGRFNNFTVGLKATLRFLAEVCDRQPESDADVAEFLRGLYATMQDDATVESMRRRIDASYG